MFNYKLAIWFFILLVLCLIIFGAIFKIMHWQGADEVLISGLASIVLLFIVVLYDMITQPIKYKPIMIIFIFSPIIVGILYTYMLKNIIEIT